MITDINKYSDENTGEEFTFLKDDSSVVRGTVDLLHHLIPPEQQNQDEVMIKDYRPYSSTLSKLPVYGNIDQDDFRPHNLYLINKVICENNIVFTKPSYIELLYYDIETYNNTKELTKVPLSDDITAHIGIITLINETLKTVDVFLYNQIYDETLIKNYLPSYKTTVTNYTNESLMCDDFFAKVFVKNVTRIVSSFSGSIGRDYGVRCGYDFVFIYLRSSWCTNHKVIYKKSSDITWITHITNYYNIFLFDYKFLSSNIFFKLKSESLKGFLEYYKLQPKENIENYTELQRAMKERQTDISSYIIYCIRDSKAIIDLEAASNLVSDRINIMTTCNIPLSVALYEKMMNIVGMMITQSKYKSGILLRQRYHNDVNHNVTQINNIVNPLMQFMFLKNYDNCCIDRSIIEKISNTNNVNLMLAASAAFTNENSIAFNSVKANSFFEFLNSSLIESLKL